jgi:hypothetical protein
MYVGIAVGVGVSVRVGVGVNVIVGGKVLVAVEVLVGCKVGVGEEVAVIVCVGTGTRTVSPIGVTTEEGWGVGEPQADKTRIRNARI